MSITKTLKTIEDALKDLVQDVREETAREIEARIRDGVSMLAGTLSRSGVVKGKPGRKPKAVATTPHKASPGRKLQGRYMGMLRRYKGRTNQQIKKLARTEGIAAAIAHMEKLNGSPAPKAKPKAVKAVAKAQPKPAKGAIVGKVRKGSDTVHLAAAVATAAKETPAPAPVQGA